MTQLERDLQASVDYYAEQARQAQLAACVPAAELPSDEELTAVGWQLTEAATPSDPIALPDWDDEPTWPGVTL